MAKVMQFLFAVVAGMFLPPVGWLVGVVPLRWRLNDKTYDKLRFHLTNLTLFAAAAFAGIAYASRRKFEPGDDFFHYYNNFVDALSSHAPAFTYGSGLEIGVPLINYLLGIIFGSLSPWQLMFAHQVILFGLLIFVTSRMKVDPIPNGIFVAFVLVAFPYIMATQLIRQSYSSIFLFLALSEAISIRRLPLLLVAFLFHLSTLPIYVFFGLAQKLKRWWFIAFLVSIAFIVLKFQDVAELILSVEMFSGQEKAGYYTDPAGGVSRSDVVPIVMYLGVFLLIALHKVYKQQWSLDRDEKVIVAVLVFSLAALPIPLLGVRVCLMVFIFLGAYLIKAAWKISPFVAGLLFLMLLANQLRIMYLTPDSSPVAFWVEYPAWSYVPGYFFLR